MDLQGAKALVTGGSEGIGRAIAVALKREGADVVITGRRADVLEAAAEEVGVGWSVGDVGSEDDAIRTVRDFVEKHGRLDILVNNAGFGRFAPLVEMELSDMEAVYRTNVFGAFLMGREAAKVFVRQKSGHLMQHLLDLRTQGRTRQHGIFVLEVRPARHDRVLARRTPEARRAGDAGQPQ